jgi:hypothetical protein
MPEWGQQRRFCVVLRMPVEPVEGYSQGQLWQPSMHTF